jgi:hypothetical protein
MPSTKPTWYKFGSWNQFCQRCGKKTKAENITREWTGLLVCNVCLEERQPQDFVRGVPDDQSVPFTTSEPVDTFVVSPPPGFSTLVSGTLTAPLAAGPENLFDNVNTLSVSTNVPMLPYATTQAAVLGGANMCAIYNGSTGLYEVVQFQNVAAGTSGAWNLTGLLRGRVGTEGAMAETFPTGSPFYYIGQSSAPLYGWINSNLFVNNVGLANLPFSPCLIKGALGTNGQDVILSWTRRSKAVRVDQADFDPIDNAPLGDADERYSVDVLGASGNAAATLNIVGAPSATFTVQEQIAAFGSIQSSYTFNVYQVSRDYGRGYFRQVTATPAALATTPSYL